MNLTTKDLEEVSCLNCGSTENHYYDSINWKDQELTYKICMKCSLKYMSPRPTQEWYSNFYKESFWQEKLDNQGYTVYSDDYKKDKILQDKFLSQRKRAIRISSILDSLIKDKPDLKILEIGAGFGQTLSLLRKKYNAKVHAIEPNQVARSIITDLNIPIIGTYAEDLEGLDEKFDVIITSHVLENLSHPKNVLGFIRKSLKEGGHYYIDTPNMYYRNQTNPYHMVVFTPESLLNFLNRNGFEAVKVHCEDFPENVDLKKESRLMDPYLSIVSKPADSVEKERNVNPEKIIENQKLGEKLRKAAQKQHAKKLFNKVRNRILRMLNIPHKVVISGERDQAQFQ